MTYTQELQWFLRAVRRRWAGVVIPEVMARALAGVGLVILAGGAMARGLAPADRPLLMLALATLIAAGGLAGRILTRLPSRPTDRQVARFVEERHPGLEDRLASAAGVLGVVEGGPLRDLVLADAASRTRTLDPSRVVTPEATWRARGRLAAAVVLLGISIAVALPPAMRALALARVYVRPVDVSLSVEPGDTRVVAGRSLRIRARLVGTAASAIGDPPNLLVTVGTETTSHTMSQGAEAFDAEIPGITTPISYRVTTGRASSREFTVGIIARPRVERIDVEYTYPSFMGLPSRTEIDGGDIYAPAGTRVRLRITADKSLRAGALAMGTGARIALRQAGDSVLEGLLQVEADASYRVALADTDGLDSTGDTEYFIRIVNDRPPDVRILRPNGDRKVTPLDEVTIEARADDDYGIDRFELVYAVRGRQEQAVPLGGRGPATSRLGSHLLFVEDLGVQPGDFITYHARARDVGRGKRAAETRSDIYFLEVKPFEEEFVAVTSQAQGSQRGDRSLEQLVRAQKAIIAATWNLHRRAAAGRSDEDIRAVARAQAELRAQTETAAALLRAGGRPRRPPAPLEGGGGEMLGRAVEAMGQAHGRLDARHLAEALPPEMEALNHLLRAEAEVRRRQVSRQQQASGAGGASGRQDQDLSSLFDRELQRQQASSYETPPRAGEEQDAKGKDPIEQIRELAERQNDLSRQQRDLARAALDDQERQRQLERLAREQTELRQQADQLAEQLARRQPAGGGAGEEPGGERQTAGEQRMRDIAGEMRGAAGDLRRQDPDAASRRADRAASELADLERQMRRAKPDDREHALGDLQLDARQLAEGARRAAKDARRLAGSSAGPQKADAYTRLAGEQARLADRVQRFEQEVRQLAGGERHGPLADSGRALDRERLSARIRRQAETPQPSPAEIDEVARSLERVGKSLADAGGSLAGAEARDLSTQLARTRELRERLSELDRRARELDPDRRATGAPDAAQGDALAELRKAYTRELRRAQDLLDQIARQAGALARGVTPEAHEYTMGAPGTQVFKQDYAEWASLRRDVGLALERYEQAVSAELAGMLAAGRLHAGANADLPEEYRALIARYYEALAKRKKN